MKYHTVTIVNTRRSNLLIINTIDYYGFRRIPYLECLCIATWDRKKLKSRKQVMILSLQLKNRSFELTPYANEILDTIEECDKKN